MSSGCRLNACIILWDSLGKSRSMKKKSQHWGLRSRHDLHRSKGMCFRTWLLRCSGRLPLPAIAFRAKGDERDMISRIVLLFAFYLAVMVKIRARRQQGRNGMRLPSDPWTLFPWSMCGGREGSKISKALKGGNGVASSSTLCRAHGRRGTGTFSTRWD